MEALRLQLNILHNRLTNLYRKQDRGYNIPKLNACDKFQTLRYDLEDIRCSWRDLEKDYQKSKEDRASIGKRIKYVRKQCQIVETKVLEDVPETTKLGERYCIISRPPYHCNRTMIEWLHEYAAYIFGMVWAIQGMEYFTPMLATLKYDLKNLENRYHDRIMLENMWTDLFNLRERMGNWESKFDLLKEEMLKVSEEEKEEEREEEKMSQPDENASCSPNPDKEGSSDL